MDVERYLSHQERLIQMRDREVATRLAQLEEAERRIVARLVQLGAKRVWRFGSLARQRGHPRSDLDLAVEGLPWTQDQLLAVAEEETSLPVDIVPLEKARPSLREHVRREGVLLYDQQGAPPG